MPVKWTTGNDHTLLLKILETHDLSVDPKRVAEAWPGDDPNCKPTPRAISERLFKMRQMAKSNGTGGKNSAPVTPRKSRAPMTPKLIENHKEEGADADLTDLKGRIANVVDETPPEERKPQGPKPRKRAQAVIKEDWDDSENSSADTNIPDESPVKRVRSSLTSPTKKAIKQERS